MRAMRKRILFLLVPIVLLVAAAAIYLGQSTIALSGVVRDAATQVSLVGAQVNLAGRNTETNAHGEYVIALPRGEYTLQVQADGYAPVQKNISGNDWLASELKIDLALETNRVSGVVRDVETQQPLPRAPIWFGSQLITTTVSGNFEARGVQSGAIISATVFGYQPFAMRFDGQANLELGLIPASTQITIKNQRTQQPIPGALVYLDNQTYAADASGQAIVRRIPQGATVRATAPGFASATVTFVGGDLPLALRPNTLDAVVLDATTNQPISGTLVYLNATIVTANAHGLFHLDNLPEQGTLMFKAPGYRKTDLDVNQAPREIKLAPFQVKGIHIPFGMVPEQVRALMDLATKTELNAIVIDVKAEKGRVAWNSQVPLAKEIGAPSLKGIDLQQVVTRCKTQNIYCIARMPVFQDLLLATSKPALAIHHPDGTVFVEQNGLAWINPYVAENQTYAIALAKEIAALGFDEIQFDYVRFPGRVSNIEWGADNTEANRVATIAGFLARAQKELRPTGVFISADVFGLTTATNDDQNTGQRLRDLTPYLDYISPMVYPDTWVDAADLLVKGLGIKNCTVAVRCPYDVIYNSYQHAAEKSQGAKVRLWLQAYEGRGNFGLPEYRLQKKAATDAGSVGWMFWSGSGTYDPQLFDGK